MNLVPASSVIYYNEKVKQLTVIGFRFPAFLANIIGFQVKENKRLIQAAQAYGGKRLSIQGSIESSKALSELPVKILGNLTKYYYFSLLVFLLLNCF